MMILPDRPDKPDASDPGRVPKIGPRDLVLSGAIRRRTHDAAATAGVVSELPLDYFSRSFVKNTRMSRTEIMPTNFPSCVTPRCRIREFAIRSLASNTV